MKYIIGLVGRAGTGKGTFASYLKQILIESQLSSGVTIVRFSDILRETLALWGIEHSRINLQNLAIDMNARFGEGTLSKAVFCHAHIRATQNRSDVIVVDGVRWESDLTVLRSYPSSVLVSLTAPAEVRWRRILKREENSGDSCLSFQEFCNQESVSTETSIDSMVTRADWTFSNVGSLDDLLYATTQFCEFLQTE